MILEKKQTAQQKLNNFLRSSEAETYPLNGYAIATLHALASYFYYSEKCWPSISQLCEYSLFSDKQVRRSLKRLEELNLIFIERKNGFGNIYIWNIPIVEDKEIYQKKPVHKTNN